MDVTVPMHLPVLAQDRGDICDGCRVEAEAVIVIITDEDMAAGIPAGKADAGVMA